MRGEVLSAISNINYKLIQIFVNSKFISRVAREITIKRKLINNDNLSVCFLWSLGVGWRKRTRMWTTSTSTSGECWRSWCRELWSARSSSVYWLSSSDAGETETGSSTSSEGSLDHSDSVKFAVLRYTIQLNSYNTCSLVVFCSPTMNKLVFPHYVGTVKLLNI